MQIPDNAPGRVNGPGDQVPPARSKADDVQSLARAIGGLYLLLTSREVERLLGVSARTLWGLRASGEIAHLKIGTSVRYRVEDVQAFVARHRREVRRDA